MEALDDLLPKDKDACGYLADTAIKHANFLLSEDDIERYDDDYGRA